MWLADNNLSVQRKERGLLGSIILHWSICAGQKIWPLLKDPRRIGGAPEVAKMLSRVNFADSRRVGRVAREI